MCHLRKGPRTPRRSIALSLAVAGIVAGRTASGRAAAFVPFVTDSTHIQAAVLAAAADIPGPAGTVCDPFGNSNDIQIVNFSTTVYTGAFDVTSTLNRIRQNDSVHNNESDDGGFFNFNSGELPNIPRMGANYYMEFMVWPNMDLVAKTYDTSAHPWTGVNFPGPARVLVGSSGEVYFTGDHYATNDYVNPTSPLATVTTSTWDVTNGTWNIAGNWSTTSVPTAGQAAYLTVSDTATRTVTYAYAGSAITLADLLVNADGTSSAHGSMTLTQAQNTLTTQNEEIWARYATAAVTQSGGTHTVLGTLQVGEFAASSGSYTLSGSGVLSAANEYIGSTPLIASAGSGTFSQTGGTHTVTNTMNIGFAGGGSGSYILTAGALSVAALSINSGGTFSDNGGSLSLSDLQLSGSGSMTLAASGQKTLKLATVSATGTSKLDLANNKLIATSASVGNWNGSNYSGMTGLIKSARNGGAWNGSGITTSMTAATASALTTLAVAAAGDVGKTSFGGVSVAPSDVLVMYTYAGDANLDGKINADDYFQIDSHYNNTADSAESYLNGDFNYDGKINGDDYFIIDQNYVRQGAAFSSGAVVPGAAAVPEPSMVGTVLILASAGSRCRKRWRLSR